MCICLYRVAESINTSVSCYACRHGCGNLRIQKNKLAKKIGGSYRPFLMILMICDNCIFTYFRSCAGCRGYRNDRASSPFEVQMSRSASAVLDNISLVYGHNRNAFSTINRTSAAECDNTVTLIVFEGTDAVSYHIIKRITLNIRINGITDAAFGQNI